MWQPNTTTLTASSLHPTLWCESESSWVINIHSMQSPLRILLATNFSQFLLLFKGLDVSFANFEKSGGWRRSKTIPRIPPLSRYKHDLPPFFSKWSCNYSGAFKSLAFFSKEIDLIAVYVQSTVNMNGHCVHIIRDKIALSHSEFHR